MGSAVLPPANNPFMDDHIVYALVIVAIALAYAGQTWGLECAYDRLSLVRRWRALRRPARTADGHFPGSGTCPSADSQEDVGSPD
jgi:hypothetical protein